jgi:hypothetical protein
MIGIRSAIAAYRSETRSFRGLLADIEAWIGSLVGIADPGWIHELRGLSNQLEAINASMFDENRTSLDDQEVRVASDILDGLETMTHRY